MEKNERYLKQVIVMRKDMGMPTGKIAAMASHAAMTFLLKRMNHELREEGVWFGGEFTGEQWRWLTELDPGIEETKQVSMAKIVLAVDSEQELQDIYDKALAAGLEVHKVIDSGYSHNKVGDFPCIAIGPDWPEKIDPITKHLKVYR